MTSDAHKIGRLAWLGGIPSAVIWLFYWLGAPSDVLVIVATCFFFILATEDSHD